MTLKVILERINKKKKYPTQSPIVGSLVVALVEDDFRGDVFGRAAECPRLAAGGEFLGKAEIHQLQIACVCQKTILRLQISENETFLKILIKNNYRN